MRIWLVFPPKLMNQASVCIIYYYGYFVNIKTFGLREANVAHIHSLFQNPRFLIPPAGGFRHGRTEPPPDPTFCPIPNLSSRNENEDAIKTSSLSLRELRESDPRPRFWRPLLCHLTKLPGSTNHKAWSVEHSRGAISWLLCGECVCGNWTSLTVFALSKPSVLNDFRHGETLAFPRPPFRS